MAARLLALSPEAAMVAQATAASGSTDTAASGSRPGFASGGSLDLCLDLDFTVFYTSPVGAGAGTGSGSAAGARSPGGAAGSGAAAVAFAPVASSGVAGGPASALRPHCPSHWKRHWSLCLCY